MSEQPETPAMPRTPTPTVADDVTNTPMVRVQHRGVTTYYADHVPDDAPSLITTKVVTPPPAPTTEPTAQAQTTEQPEAPAPEQPST